ncbi:MAG TPA: peptidase C39 family protein [Cyclobacteriaceae bacterium]|nr:peptidase C39 family protein [Cyclobacteriaceae bacterium]
MLLRVPFRPQESQNECGPTALQMVLEYFGHKCSKEQLTNLVQSETNGITWTLGLARAASILGFETEFYSTCLDLNSNHHSIDFYKNVAPDAMRTKTKLANLRTECALLGVKVAEEYLSLEEILLKINNDCLPICLIDWSRINGTEKFIGHFVPIVGYCAANVYVHDPGLNNPRANVEIERVLFDKARQMPGTDQDIVFIHRKLPLNSIEY